MSTQNKMSIKQVIKSEYKIIGLFSAIAILLPFISEAIFVGDLVQFKGLSALEKLGALLGVSDFAFTDVSILVTIGMVISAVCIPIFAVIMARKLNGQRLLKSLTDGLKDISTKRFWQYILKVYVPFIIIILAVVIAAGFIPDTVILNVLSSLFASTAALLFAAILLIVISVLVTSITGMIFVANVVYMRGTNGIRQSFKAIPGREANKLVIFNAIESIVGILIVFGFVIPLVMQEPLSFIANLVSYAIALVVSLMIYQVVFIYLRFSLYMNIASKVEVEGLPKTVKAVKTAKPIETAKTAEENQVEVEETVVELAVKPKGTNRIKNQQIDNPFELSIKPKGAKRSKLNNDEQLSSNKPKRSIK